MQELINIKRKKNVEVATNLLRSSAALAQTKRMEMRRSRTLERRDRRVYPHTWNTNHVDTKPINMLIAASFLLHRITSATVTTDTHGLILTQYIKLYRI